MASKAFNIKTVNGKLVILRDNGSGYDVKSDGASHEFSSQEAQFYVDSGHAGNNLLYRFRPVSQPNKYLAAFRSKIILKTIPTTGGSSYDFLVLQTNDGYDTFLYRNSAVNSAQFMSTNSNNDVILAGKSSNAKFVLSQTKVISSFQTLSAPDYPADEFEEFFKEANNEPMISLEIEEESFSGKLIVSERISISEE